MYKGSTLAVSVQGLERRFGSFVAVDRISFDVPKGAIYGFLGPNGAGKSTTIRMLCGILAPSGGQGSVGGYNLLTETEKIKTSIGYMSQKFSLYEDLTVEENIDFYSGIYCVPEEKKAARKAWVVEMAHLKQQLHIRTSTLPAGWKQRLALGCACLHEPSILFLDEPTAGVDPITRRQFWNLIYEMASHGVTIFVTTHYMDEAEYFDTICFIYQGQLIAQGAPSRLKQEMMRDEILELVCKEPQNVMPWVKKLPGVKEVALFGRGLHIVVENGAFVQKTVEEELVRQKSLAGWSLEKIEPSLEDLFVSLIETHDQRCRS